MAREEIYQATKKIFALYGAFYSLVVQQIGTEKALNLHAKAHEQLGITAGKMTRDKLGKATPGLQSLGNILRESNLSIGIESEVAQSNPTSIVFRNLQCPLYDGYQLGGLDDKTAELLCQRGAPAKLGSILTYLNLDTKYNLQHYRRKPDEPCEEVIELKGYQRKIGPCIFFQGLIAPRFISVITGYDFCYVHRKSENVKSFDMQTIYAIMRINWTVWER